MLYYFFCIFCLYFPLIYHYNNNCHYDVNLFFILVPDMEIRV